MNNNITMTKTLHIFEIIDKNVAILHSDGIKVFEEIEKALKNNSILNVSFKNIEVCTTAFLNSSIGKIFLLNEEYKKKIKLVEFENKELIEDKIQIVLKNIENKKSLESYENSIRTEFYS